MRAAKALGLAGLLAAISQFLTDGLRLIHHSLEAFQLGSLLNLLNKKFPGDAWMGRTVMFYWDPIFIAAGSITGMKVCLSMLVGGTLCWAAYMCLSYRIKVSSRAQAFGRSCRGRFGAAPPAWSAPDCLAFSCNGAHH